MRPAPLVADPAGDADVQIEIEVGRELCAGAREAVNDGPDEPIPVTSHDLQERLVGIPLVLIAGLVATGIEPLYSLMRSVPGPSSTKLMRFLLFVAFGTAVLAARSRCSRSRLDRRPSYSKLRELVAFAVGKSLGTSLRVTSSVAAHSVPRNSVVMNPTHSML